MMLTENKDLDDFCEENLPWGVNNGLRLLSILLLSPVIYFLLILMFAIYLLTSPFNRGFYDGSNQLKWGWEIAEGVLDGPF